MHLNDITLTERRQRSKDIFYIIPLYEVQEQVKLIQGHRNKKFVVSQDGSRRVIRDC